MAEVVFFFSVKRETLWAEKLGQPGSRHWNERHRKWKINEMNGHRLTSKSPLKKLPDMPLFDIDINQSIPVWNCFLAGFFFQLLSLICWFILLIQFQWFHSNVFIVYLISYYNNSYNITHYLMKSFIYLFITPFIDLFYWFNFSNIT